MSCAGVPLRGRQVFSDREVFMWLKVQAAWQSNPVRGAALITGVVVAVLAKLGVVVDQASVGQAVALIVPFVLAGEVSRSHVVPIHKLVTDPKLLPPDEIDDGTTL